MQKQVPADFYCSSVVSGQKGNTLPVKLRKKLFGWFVWVGFCVYLLKKKFKHFWNFKVWWQFVWGFFVYLFLLLCFWLALLLFSEGNILLLSLFVKASLIWASSLVKSFSFSLWSKRSIVIIFNFVTKQRYSYGYNLCAVFGWCFSQHWDSEF